eukprot:1153767-Pelagomonas_calceolata.AAC.4
MPPKESAVDLSKHVDKSLRILLAGGRQGPFINTCAVSGTLKGYDQLLNLVLDEAVEYIRGARLRGLLQCSKCLFAP